ncbi:MAG: hypothetical protein H7Z40_04890, partial [Phycisphaerae bacterium]|nr:hypothetical protein [Gemmatimonadaceae bacterium]
MPANRRDIGLPLIVRCIVVLACACKPAVDDVQTQGAVVPPTVQASGVSAPPTVAFGSFADTLHGVVVPDPLRWLEDTLSADTRSWITAQSAYTDSVLAKLEGRDSLAAGLERAYAAMPTLGDVVRTNSRTLLTRYLGDTPSLMALDSGQNVEREVISAASLEQAHPGARIRTFVPSWDGRYVALGITARGDGAAAIVVVDAANGRVMPDVVVSKSGTR